MKRTPIHKGTPSHPTRTGHVHRHMEVRDTVHQDAYRTDEKLGNSVCRRCGAAYLHGRWQHAMPAADAKEVTCPACRRIEDGFPAGYVSLHGERVSAERDALVRIARNVEAREQSEHPLQRLMAIGDDAEGLEITTTDVHLARAIGEAVQHAHGGRLTVRYGDDDTVRVLWES